MNLSKLVACSFILALLPGVAACQDGEAAREPDDLGTGETGDDASTGGMTTGVEGTAGTGTTQSPADESSTGGESSSTTGSEVESETTSSTGEGETTTGAVPEAPEDGDGAEAPAVYAQFRATAGAPVSVEGPLFNEEPLDVQGLQYLDAVSVPGDGLDVIHFRIVPGEVDPTIAVELECDLGVEPLIRASIYDADGGLVDAVTCGEGAQNVFLEGASSLDVYRVEIEALEEAPILSEYTLSLNGFCFQACNYQPYEG